MKEKVLVIDKKGLNYLVMKQTFVRNLIKHMNLQKEIFPIFNKWKLTVAGTELDAVLNQMIKSLCWHLFLETH